MKFHSNILPVAGAIRTARDLAFYRSARAIAVISGLFCLIVSATLIGQRIFASANATWKSPEIENFKVKLRASPQDEPLKNQIRVLDLELRERYFKRLALSATGSSLLWCGAVVFLFAAKLAATFHRKLPLPQPRPEGSGESATGVPGQRWSVAAAGSLVLVTFLALAMTASSTIPHHPADLAKFTGAAASTSDAAAVDAPSLEEMQANWPRFRGADGSGGSIQTNLPPTWETNTGSGILWKAAVPGTGFSSPVIWNDRVFLSSGDSNKCAVICLNAVNGDLLWERAIERKPGEPSEMPDTPLQAGYAAATMASDGKRAYAIFSTGDLVALDFAGKTVWTKSLGFPKNAYGHASSLLTWEGKLIVQLDQGEAEERRSRLYAFEGPTGRILWQRQRPVPSSWATPIVIQAADKAQIITLGVPWLIAYAASDGTELWRAECLNGEITPSPIFAGGFVLAISPMEKLMAIRPDGRGDVTKTHLAWSAEENVPDITCPASNGELVFTLATHGVLTCLDIKDGKKQWEHDFETEFQASPSIAGNRLYLFGMKGTVVVVETSRQFNQLVRFEMGEPIVASPGFSNGRMYLRTARNLYCIGTKEPKVANQVRARASQARFKDAAFPLTPALSQGEKENVSQRVGRPGLLDFGRLASPGIVATRANCPERGCVRSTSRSGPTIPTCCGWVSDHSRAPFCLRLRHAALERGTQLSGTLPSSRTLSRFDVLPIPNRRDSRLKICATAECTPGARFESPAAGHGKS
ncbi:MAG: PQQ-binding-like beta-propeller repeat protein [Verrucomicrobia bacterium]|nr:PQQ-binding-like beta-propeller repeat protein [Verrucomicrobiota bacterium]